MKGGDDARRPRGSSISISTLLERAGSALDRGRAWGGGTRQQSVELKKKFIDKFQSLQADSDTLSFVRLLWLPEAMAVGPPLCRSKTLQR